MTDARIVDGYMVSAVGRSFKHTTQPWHICRNKHRNTNNTDWGWIEGPAGDATWSDDKAFNRAAAERVVSLHNQWLEAQKPMSLQLIEADQKLSAAARRLKDANEELDAAERQHRIARELVDSLEQCSVPQRETKP
jgi:hypothetical protein